MYLVTLGHDCKHQGKVNIMKCGFGVQDEAFRYIVVMVICDISCENPDV